MHIHPMYYTTVSHDADNCTMQSAVLMLRYTKVAKQLVQCKYIESYHW